MTQNQKNAPSKTGKPSGPGRSNAPPRTPEQKRHAVRPVEPTPPPKPKKD